LGDFVSFWKNEGYKVFVFRPDLPPYGRAFQAFLLLLRMVLQKDERLENALCIDNGDSGPERI